MPKVTVYVRKEDYPKWKALPKKTAFISSALDGEAIPPTRVDAVSESSSTHETFVPKPTLVKPPVEEIFNIKLCKHGASPEFCKFAKPGKPCK